MERSEEPLHALQDILRKVQNIRTERWAISRIPGTNQWEQPIPMPRINFGEAVEIVYRQSNISSFRWNVRPGFPDILDSYEHPIVTYFEFFDDHSYIPIFVHLDDDMVSEGGGEIGLFINGKCYGAEVIMGEVVQINAYILDVDLTDAVVEFKIHEYGARSMPQSIIDFHVFDQNSNVVSRGNIDFSRNESFYQVSLRSDGSKREPTTIDMIAPNVLIGNHPNPFNPSTTISYNLGQQGNVRLQIFNIRGQLVRTLVNEVQHVGFHSVIWNGDDNFGNPVSSGIYFYRLDTSSGSETRRMLLMK
jgi:hypothetical protein